MHGSIIGGIIIALGLYSVVWGKAKDYSEPKLASADAQVRKSQQTAATVDSKIDIISENLEKQTSTEHNKIGEEREMYVV